MRKAYELAPEADIALRPAAALQRACACGELAGISGKCPSCAASARFGVQPKLSLSAPGDHYEQEADRIADQVVSSGSAPTVQRMEDPGDAGTAQAAPAPSISLLQRQADGEEEEEALQTKRTSGPARVSAGAVAGAAATAAAGGQPLSRFERGWFEPRLGHDLSAVRIHPDAEAAGAIDARAYTRGHHVVFAPGQYESRSTEGRRLLAHELVHTLQQGVRGSGGLQRKTLADLDKKVRASLRFSRVAPTPAVVAKWVTGYFDPSSGISATTSTKPEFGAEITNAGVKKALTSIAAELLSLSRVIVTPATDKTPETKTQTDRDKWPLAPDSILDLELDPTAFGQDHAIYRFIRYTDGKSTKVLVERRKVLTPAQTTAAPSSSPSAGQGGPRLTPMPQPRPASQATRAATPSFTGSVSVGAITIDVDTSFGDARGKVIADAVALLPAPIGAKADGVRFVDAGSGNGPEGENGHYDPEKDQIKIWGDLFKRSARRIGEASSPAYQVVHEIGHALDLRPEFQAQNARKTAADKKTKLEKELKTVDTRSVLDDTSGDPLAGLGGDSAKVKTEKKRLKDEIAKMDKEIAKHNAAMASAASVSGHELGKDEEELKTDFGKALKADGVSVVKKAKQSNRLAEAKHQKEVEKAEKEAAKTGSDPRLPDRPEPKDTLSGGVSNYAETDLTEAFAENFAYYILDEKTLELIRPKTHAFFKKHFPKKAAAQKAGGGKP